MSREARTRRQSCPAPCSRSINGVGLRVGPPRSFRRPRAKQTVLTVGDTISFLSFLLFPSLFISRRHCRAPAANPHRWYSPANVRTRHRSHNGRLHVDRIRQRCRLHIQTASTTPVVNTSSSSYIRPASISIKKTYRGTPVGMPRSHLRTPLPEATGLDLVHAPSFLDAISEGGDPTAARKAVTIDTHDREKKHQGVRVQQPNATPDADSARWDAPRPTGSSSQPNHRDDVAGRARP